MSIASNSCHKKISLHDEMMKSGVVSVSNLLAVKTKYRDSFSDGYQTEKSGVKSCHKI